MSPVSPLPLGGRGAGGEGAPPCLAASAALIAIAALLVLYFAMDVRSTADHDVRLLAGWPLPVGLSRLAANVANTRPDPGEVALFDWARTRTDLDALFAVPPVDTRFLKFRLAAERGVYASVHDVNQLAFDKSVYALAHRRLLTLGLAVLGRHQFDEAGYYALPPDRYRQLASEGVSYVIFDRARLNERPNLPVAYEDASYVVFRLSGGRS
ncbi:MAG: hypothetical protein HY331_16890 [Chloroflexi bacterium]|nr:hypothetical protein [Chloroflexota bacterium]